MSFNRKKGKVSPNERYLKEVKAIYDNPERWAEVVNARESIRTNSGNINFDNKNALEDFLNAVDAGPIIKNKNLAKTEITFNDEVYLIDESRIDAVLKECIAENELKNISLRDKIIFEAIIIQIQDKFVFPQLSEKLSEANIEFSHLSQNANGKLTKEMEDAQSKLLLASKNLRAGVASYYSYIGEHFIQPEVGKLNTYRDENEMENIFGDDLDVSNRMKAPVSNLTINTTYELVDYNSACNELRHEIVNTDNPTLKSTGENFLKIAENAVSSGSIKQDELPQLTANVKTTTALIQDPENEERLVNHSRQTEEALSSKRPWKKLVGGAMLCVLGAAVITASIAAFVLTSGVFPEVSIAGAAIGADLIQKGYQICKAAAAGIRLSSSGNSFFKKTAKKDDTDIELENRQVNLPKKER